MGDMKQQLLQWIEEDRDKLIGFYSQFVATPSPNPPGDTRDAVAHISKFLHEHDLEFRLVDPEPMFPNVVASFDGDGDGKHLVLNGHIDVFPAADEGWQHGGPWSGAIADDAVWGRGSADMKCGTSTSIFTFMYLNRIKELLKGKLTLTCVSDEETFGPWGARYLVDNLPEVHGDCCLNGEPSSPYSIRFGEKGPWWVSFRIRTKGAHGAYVHAGGSASWAAMQFCNDLKAIEAIDTPAPHNVGQALEDAREETDRAMGKGASDIVQKVTLNIGRMDAGLKVNMVPDECVIEADMRLPVGCEEGTGAEGHRRGACPPSRCRDGGNELHRAVMVRSLWRNGDAPAKQRRDIARFPPDAGDQPGRHRCPPVALPWHRRLRLWPLARRHGPA